jgi:hydrogenase maturation factor
LDFAVQDELAAVEESQLFGDYIVVGLGVVMSLCGL